MGRGHLKARRLVQNPFGGGWRDLGLNRRRRVDRFFAAGCGRRLYPLSRLPADPADAR